MGTKPGKSVFDEWSKHEANWAKIDPLTGVRRNMPNQQITPPPAVEEEEIKVPVWDLALHISPFFEIGGKSVNGINVKFLSVIINQGEPYDTHFSYAIISVDQIRHLGTMEDVAKHVLKVIAKKINQTDQYYAGHSSGSRRLGTIKSPSTDLLVWADSKAEANGHNMRLDVTEKRSACG